MNEPSAVRRITLQEVMTNGITTVTHPRWSWSALRSWVTDYFQTVTEAQVSKPSLTDKRVEAVVTQAGSPPSAASEDVTGTDKTLDVPSNISGNESLKHDPAAPTSPAPRQKRLTNLADTVRLTDDGGKSEMKEREGKKKMPESHRSCPVPHCLECLVLSVTAHRRAGRASLKLIRQAWTALCEK
ncbi:hypothetical protein QQF64_016856 [Cirrhinus molitorella]|uniref:Uncharacterized protein n=1 Tax=Cirrhinus molitorella TaxID=172907 RepID=A0ABR3LNZ7_9TELE